MSARAERPGRRTPALNPRQRNGRAVLLALLVLAAVAPTHPFPSTRNRTRHPLWIRPEYSIRPIALLPAASSGGVDALADPVSHPGLIFRACDYCTVIVEEGGRVRVLCSGLAASACQLLRGGWKDERWQRRQHVAHYDHDWDPLFLRAGRVPPRLR